MTNPDRTYLGLVVDRSGSMGWLAHSASQQINSFLDEQREVPGDCDVLFNEFNNSTRKVYKGDIGKAPSDYRLQAHGGTALYDALAKTIIDIGREISEISEPARPGNVVIAVLTDGQENASSGEYRSKVALEKLIKQQEEKYNWRFVFLSSDLGATQQAEWIGFKPENVLLFAASEQGYNVASSTLSNYTTTTRSGVSTNLVSSVSSATDN